MNTLQATRCRLEPQVAAHAAEMFRVLSDPAIYDFENAPPASEAWLHERFARLESRRSADGRERWLNWVIRLDGGELAGYTQATVPAGGGVAFIAYELASRHWRQGIGSSAVRAMLDELAATEGVARFLAVLKTRNFRSMALLRSLGFAEAGPGDAALATVEPDETLMHRAATLAAAPR